MGFKEELKTKSLFSNLSFFIPCSTRLKPAYSMGGWTVTYGISRGLSAHNTMHIIHYSTVKHGSTARAQAVDPCIHEMQCHRFSGWGVCAIVLVMLKMGAFHTMNLCKHIVWKDSFRLITELDKNKPKWLHTFSFETKIKQVKTIN